jgi:hypothetical protein
MTKTNGEVFKIQTCWRLARLQEPAHPFDVTFEKRGIILIRQRTTVLANINSAAVKEFYCPAACVHRVHGLHARALLLSPPSLANMSVGGGSDSLCV